MEYLKKIKQKDKSDIFEYNNKKYLIGNIHTDYISTEVKIKGTVKSIIWIQ